MMTRKHFQEFADMYAAEWAMAKTSPNKDRAWTVRNIVFSTADLFQQQNPRFDRDRFYLAVFGPEGSDLTFSS